MLLGVEGVGSLRQLVADLHEEGLHGPVQGARMDLSCETCGRHELLMVMDLRVKLSADMLLTYACSALTDNCSRKAQPVYEQCGAVFVLPSVSMLPQATKDRLVPRVGV